MNGRKNKRKNNDDSKEARRARYARKKGSKRDRKRPRLDKYFWDAEDYEQ